MHANLKVLVRKPTKKRQKMLGNCFFSTANRFKIVSMMVQTSFSNDYSMVIAWRFKILGAIFCNGFGPTITESSMIVIFSFEQRYVIILWMKNIVTSHSTQLRLSNCLRQYWLNWIGWNICFYSSVFLCYTTAY